MTSFFDLLLRGREPWHTPARHMSQRAMNPTPGRNGGSPYPVMDLMEALRSAPWVKKFEIGDLLFANFLCPPQPGWVGNWAQTDCLIHVVTGQKTVKTATETWTIGPGQTLFCKKGAYLVRTDFEGELCVFMFFIPDTFVRETVRGLAADFRETAPSPDPREQVIAVNADATLTAFLQAMTVYFAAEEKPPEPLLTLKLRELITSLVLSTGNPALSAYFRSALVCDAPSVEAIMEANFRRNLPMKAFAQMCHRSLSSFKREFRMHYGTSPGRWLLERRLECSAHLLRTTNLSLTEIVFECGFEGSSHFSRAFKEKFGQPPRSFREACNVVA
jgi:AraC family transcriptional regulator, exoenzyme S synthesis regulatory protein ExsA